MSLTPSRRAPSNRHLPLPSPSTSVRSSTANLTTSDSWSSSALPSSSTKTSYTSFTRLLKKPKRKSDPTKILFAVGEPVLVSVLSGGTGGGLPAVGVVVEMWERTERNDSDEEESKSESDLGGVEGEAEGRDREEEGAGMWVRVKWFQRVREVPRMMHQRLGGVGDMLKLYYTSSSPTLSHTASFSPPIPTTSLLSPARILSRPPPKPKAITVDPGTGRKLAQGKGWTYVEEEGSSASDDSDASGGEDAEGGGGKLKISGATELGSFQFGRLEVPKTYWCAGICDSRGGEVWEWEEVGYKEGWEGFQKDAMRKGREAAKDLEKEGRLEGWLTKRPKRANKKSGAMTAAAVERKVEKGKGKAVAKPIKRITTSPSKSSLSQRARRPSRSLSPSSDENHSSGSEASIKSSGSSSESSGSASASDSSLSEEEAYETRRAAGGRGRSGKVARTTGGSVAAERKLAKKKAVQDRKIKSTIKRLRAPKARPLVDLVEGKLPQDPYARAMHLLHVGATPETLPCREEQYADVLVKIEGVIEGGGGGCIYISGQPGTGKTATVHAVVRELRQKAQDLEIPPFEYVEINGLKIPDPGHAYVVLWEAICGGSVDPDDVAAEGGAAGGGVGKKVSAKTALRGLEGHFSGRGGAGVGGARNCTYVVLMDELDQLFTAKQDVVYNFFNWPTIPGSQLVVIAVANTMDMPEKLAGRVKSRMGMERINFPPYTKDQLVEIAQSRLIPHPSPEGPLGKLSHQVIEKEALMLAAARTTGVTGDARRMLDVCRRAVEVASLPNPSATTTQPASFVPGPVKMKQILAVLVEMSKNPTAQFVRNCTLYEKVMLAAVVRGVRKAGVGEVEWGKIKSDHALLLSSLTLLPSSQTRLLPSEYLTILASLASSYALSVAGGGSGGLDEQRKVGLGSGMDESEVGRVLRDLKGEVGGERWRGMFE